MANQLHIGFERKEKSSLSYCMLCGAKIIDLRCRCSGNPTVWQLPIPEKWEEYFWLDPSVKGKLIDLTSKLKTYEHD